MWLDLITYSATILNFFSSVIDILNCQELNNCANMDYVDLTVNLAAEGNYSILYLVMLSWIHSKYVCKQPNFTTQFAITNSQLTTAIEIIINFIVID